MEKPTKLVAGQRWRSLSGNEFTLTADFVARESEADKRGYIEAWTYLGGPTESDKSGEVPAPAAGQRWRDLGAGPEAQRYRYNGGEPFTIIGRWRDDPKRGWECKEGGYWADDAFARDPVRLEFVDHGPPQVPIAGTPAKILAKTPTDGDSAPVASPAPIRGGPGGLALCKHGNVICNEGSCAVEARGSYEPLTRLNAIKAKRMEPAPPVERWVPSDPDGDIPDYFPSRR